MDKNTKNTKNNGTDGTLSDKKEKFLKKLSNNLGNVTQTCKDLNVGRRTFYHWKEDDEQFKESCDNVPEELLDMAENALLTEIKDSKSKGHTTAYIFYLKTKGKNRGYDERQQIELVKPFNRIELEDI
tara:strand:+ start:100 stop:483 length:384 start_codon:yes stop_codon:yes gene_type:complete